MNGVGAFAGSDPNGYAYKTVWEGGTPPARSAYQTYVRKFWDSNYTWQQRQQRILSATDAMLADGLLKWKPSNAPPVQVRFRQQQPTRITGKRPKAFLFAGITAEAGIVSQELAALIIALGSGDSGGFSFPLTFPLGSDATVLGAGVANNAGTRPAWPTFTFRGPMSNPSVTSLRYGRTIRFIYSLSAGETLVVRTQPGRVSVRLNGVTDRYDALDWAGSTWFPLAPGANELRVGADSYSDGSSLTVNHRHTWG